MSSYFLDNFKFAVFDLDGTLVNSMPVYQDTFASILERYGVERGFCQRYYQNSAGTPLAKQFERMMPPELVEKDPMLIPSLVNEFFSLVESLDFEFFSGVKHLLHLLKQRGKSMFVSTGTRNPQARLERIGCYYFFVRAIGADELPKGPEHFHLFAECLGVSVPEFCANAFMVGDGPSDMRLARQMRVGYAIGVTNTVDSEKLMASGADETIDDIRDLMTLA
jgi:phosphoglycolate phosphatase-like HAD superfamily hydrolase